MNNNNSLATEQKFEKRKDFSIFGAGAILLMHDIKYLSDEHFQELYDCTKELVNQNVFELRTMMVSDQIDYEHRNKLWDFFIELLN